MEATEDESDEELDDIFWVLVDCDEDAETVSRIVNESRQINIHRDS